MQDYAYICDDEGGGAFYIVDVSEQSFPKVVNSLTMPGAYDVCIDFPRAYIVSDTDGFYILDVSDPESVASLGHSDIDARGRLVSTLLSGAIESGLHELVWDGKALNGEKAASGTYFLRLRNGSMFRSIKMIMME